MRFVDSVILDPRAWRRGAGSAARQVNDDREQIDGSRSPLRDGDVAPEPGAGKETWISSEIRFGAGKNRPFVRPDSRTDLSAKIGGLAREAGRDS
jgi:hypothetical protein